LHALTVYRDWDSATGYQICSRNTGLCLTVDGGNGSDGTRITQTSSSSSINQRFRITPVASGQCKSCSSKSGKC
jgi:hypothetical protein